MNDSPLTLKPLWVACALLASAGALGSFHFVNDRLKSLERQQRAESLNLKQQERWRDELAPYTEETRDRLRQEAAAVRPVILNSSRVEELRGLLQHPWMVEVKPTNADQVAASSNASWRITVEQRDAGMTEWARFFNVVSQLQGTPGLRIGSVRVEAAGDHRARRFRSLHVAVSFKTEQNVIW